MKQVWRRVRSKKGKTAFLLFEDFLQRESPEEKKKRGGSAEKKEL